MAKIISDPHQTHINQTLIDPTPADLLTTHPYMTLGSSGLMLENVSLKRVADNVGTPCWVIGGGVIKERLHRLKAAMHTVGLNVHFHYAVKANDHYAILSLIKNEGYGADIVSFGELSRTQKAGIPAQQVVFSGIGKTTVDIEQALGLGIGQINVESAEELAIISAIATRMGKTAPIALRINPDIDAQTHSKITTGLSHNKFGIPFVDAIALYAHAARLPGINLLGFATHIGSQILTMDPYRAAYDRMASLVRAARDQGLSVRVVDCGGGLGISYNTLPEAQPEDLAKVIHTTLGALDVQIALEPRRLIVGPAVVLLSRVILRKEQGMAVPFLVIDSAMNDLLRPSLYEAWHGILPLSAKAFQQPLEKTHVVGPVCESSDCFAKNRLLPRLQRQDYLAILDTGAYGSVMSSTYNSRPLAAHVLIENSCWKIIRERQTIEDLWRGELSPLH
ncbi:MAG: diaminopimelate decarboxylase [Acetobacter sp.]|nr:diaminopimelate decarboxylase [Acetobacter sp.]